MTFRFEGLMVYSTVTNRGLCPKSQGCDTEEQSYILPTPGGGDSGKARWEFWA